MRRWRDPSGQAANEYVALLAIVAIVLVSAIGLTSGGIGSHVLAGMQTGICRVVGRACPRPIVPRADLKACPVERRVREERLSETLAVVKLGTSGTLTVVRHSDGTATVTIADGSAGGLEVGVGARFHVGTRGFDAEAKASGDLVWSSGRSWSFPTVEDAERFVDRYGDKATMHGKLVDEVRGHCSILCDLVGWRPHPELPQADETYRDHGSVGTLSASLGLGGVALGGELRNGRLLGRRGDRDGRQTWYFQASDALGARLASANGEASAALRGSTVISFENDAHGTPLTLQISRAGERSSSGSLALERGGASRHAGKVAGIEGTGGIEEVDMTLDLHDPADRAAAAGLLELLNDRGTLLAHPERVAAVAERIDEHGQIDKRTYELDTSASSTGGSLALGAKFGASLDRNARDMRLVDAVTRLPGLPFLARQDCLAA